MRARRPMTANDQEHIRRLMKHVVWDYDVDPYELHEVVLGKRRKVGHFDRTRVFLRMLERLSWYDLLDLLTVDLLRDLLTPETIAEIRRRDVRERYEHVEAYFRTKLYPLQDGILDIVQRSGTPFYLTGGTALSRGRYEHRFSEDLDLFVDNDPSYAAHVDTLFALLKSAERSGGFLLDTDRLRRSEWHTQLWVSREDGEVVDLKIDLVNDTGPHARAPEIVPGSEEPTIGRTFWRTRLRRFFAMSPRTPRIFWIISPGGLPYWREVFSNASAKEGGVDPVAVHDILRGIPEDELARVIWAAPADLSAVRADLRTAAEDILYGRANSLSTARGG